MTRPVTAGPAASGPSPVAAADRSADGLVLDGVTVTYGDTVAVDRITLTAPASGVLALLGPSGCGKSTLLRAVAGLEPLAGGRISFAGEDLDGIPVHRRQFGLMFQDSVLFGHRTVAGNIGYGLRVKGMPVAARRGRIAEMLDLVGLPGYDDRPIGTLSGGQAQRVALARALAPQPRLLLLDEPLAALDAALREQLLLDLRGILDAAGTPAVFVTHDQDEGYAIADRVALLRAGRLVQQGSRDEVWQHPADADAARFLGYRTVLAEGRSLPGLAGLAGPGRRVALRPSALVVAAGGEVRGVVAQAEPGPDRTVLTVRADDGTELPAVAEHGEPVVPGTPVSLRVRASGAASIPSRGILDP